MKVTNAPNPAQLAKAWINFNGTGTIAIRSSYNVSGIVDNGTGDYTVTLDVDQPDANYCVVASGGKTVNAATYPLYNLVQPNTLAAGSFDILTGVFSTGYVIYDFELVTAAVFGG